MCMNVKFFALVPLLFTCVVQASAEQDVIINTSFSVASGQRDTKSFTVIEPQGTNQLKSFLITAPDSGNGINCELSLRDAANNLIGKYDCGYSRKITFDKPLVSKSFSSSIELYNADFTVGAPDSFQFQTVWSFDYVEQPQIPPIPALLKKQEIRSVTMIKWGPSIFSPIYGTASFDVYPSANFPALVDVKWQAVTTQSTKCEVTLSGYKTLANGYSSRVLYISQPASGCSSFNIKQLFTSLSVLNDLSRLNVDLKITTPGISIAGSTVQTTLETTWGSINDNDVDGLPAWFEQLYGLSDNSSQDAQTDLDQDGFSNLAEFNAGTNPLLATSKP